MFIVLSVDTLSFCLRCFLWLSVDTSPGLVGAGGGEGARGGREARLARGTVGDEE